MTRFLTESGGVITAADEESAEIIAAERGMGDIVGLAQERKPYKHKAGSALRPIGVWCEAAQTWDVCPTRDYVAVAHKWLYEEQDRSNRLAALGHNGTPMRLNISERIAFYEAQS